MRGKTVAPPRREKREKKLISQEINVYSRIQSFANVSKCLFSKPSTSIARKNQARILMNEAQPPLEKLWEQ